MLALPVAKINSQYDRFAISVPARSSAPLQSRLAKWERERPKGLRGIKGNGDITEARFTLRGIILFDVGFQASGNELKLLYLLELRSQVCRNDDTKVVTQD